ncbi:hypothetical protein HPB47_009671 [Ixodes persulcatus]|uniref:Uncharacterized protein n=1 Tax=Ixodes persulcatus TaxID=34615 RepID=A0AC60P168_IXOPE|nr:hypothetical protein HPB47_009671 [Ixodes persulcatus]
MTTPLVAPPRLQLLQATQDHAAVTSCETSPPPSQEMDEDAEDFGPSNNAKRFRSSDDSLKDADTSLQASWASREPDATDLEGLWEKATTRTQRRAQLKASGQPLPTTSRKERVTLGTHVIKIQPTERCDVLGLDPEELKTVISSFAGDLKLLKHQILRVSKLSNTIVVTTCDSTQATRLLRMGVLPLRSRPPLPVRTHQVPTDGISRGVIHGCKPKEPTAKLLEALYADGPPAARLTSRSAATAENNTSNPRKPARMARPSTAVIVNRMDTWLPIPLVPLELNSLSARNKGKEPNKKEWHGAARASAGSDLSNPLAPLTHVPLRGSSKVQIQDPLHSYADITARGLKGGRSPNARQMLETLQVEQDRDQADFDSTMKRLEQQLKEIQRTMEQVKCKHNQRQKSRAGRLRALHLEIEEEERLEHELLERSKRRQSLSPGRRNQSPPNSSLAHPPPERPPDLLQWNCRSLRQSATELVELFRLTGRPAALLLQETRGTSPGISGFNGYFQPTIEHGLRGGSSDTSQTIEAQAAVFVRKGLPQAQIDTTAYCNPFQEVVAVRCTLGRHRVILTSYYARPESSCSRRGHAGRAGFQWLMDLRQRYPRDRLLVAGDFNAHHPDWGYSTANARGARLKEAAELAHLTLANDLDYPTRHGLHEGQRDTTPDLTWADSRLVTDWRCGPDPMGSDHYPIWLELSTGGKAGRRRLTQAIDWDAFRKAVATCEDAVPVTAKLLRAAQAATRNLEVEDQDPVPDKHLINLWEARKRLHKIYVNNGKRFKDLVRLRNKTAQARRYAKRLARSRWLDNCATFDERTGTRKLWRAHRALTGKTKAPNTARNIQLATDQTSEQFEEAAAKAFFPQPANDPDLCLYELQPPSDTEQDAPFTIQEFTLALDSINERSAPGKDGITWRMLRNLDEPEKRKLRRKSPDQIQNLRPISLTSTLCKLLERMVLTRLTYVLEEARDDPHYDAAQTGFRPGLCTHDSLHLLRNFVGKRRRGTNKVPGLLVAVDLRKAFDTVEHSAVIEALEESGAGTRIINFVKSFLKNRTFEISSGAQQPRMFQNFRGVPQGAILSPTLFNLVMSKIARVLRAVPHLQHTTYADDITLWVDPRNTKLDTKETVVTMQTALDAIDQCLQTTGMQPSPEKTAFLIVGGLEHNRAQVHLTLSGQPIQRSPERWIRILGVPLHEQGGAQEWIKQLKPKWRQQLQLIQRMGNRLGGAGTRTIRLLTQAVLTSKACYGAACFILTKEQHKQLEILHRECLRAITGLPRHTKTEELYRYSNLPTLQAIIETRVAGHQRRRTSTRAGQRLLELQGWRPPVGEAPPPKSIPPWEDTMVRNPKPLTRKQHREEYSEERAALAARADLVEHAVFTDAAWCQETKRATLAYATGQDRYAQTLQYDSEPSTSRLELDAIHLALSRIRETFDPVDIPTRVTIFTDCREALARLGKTPREGTLCQRIKSLCSCLKHTKGIEVRVYWVPGHAGGIGNEAAHAWASEHREDRSNPGIFVPFAPPDPDPLEKKSAARQEDQRRLRDQTPYNPAPLPKGLPRGAQVLIHKARTGAALTEDILARWRNYKPRRGRPPDQAPSEGSEPAALVVCTTCTAGVSPTIRHLL